MVRSFFGMKTMSNLQVFRHENFSAKLYTLVVHRKPEQKQKKEAKLK